MTLVDLLAEDLLHWLGLAPDGVTRRVLLWLDPEGQFRRLTPHLESALRARGVQFFGNDPTNGASQFQLKLELLRLEAEPHAPVVVYLPGFDRDALEPRADGRPPALWSVYDYRFKGCIWGRGERWEPGVVPELLTLYEWLHRRRLKVADERTRKVLQAGGADALLARYARRAEMGHSPYRLAPTVAPRGCRRSARRRSARCPTAASRLPDE